MAHGVRKENRNARQNTQCLQLSANFPFEFVCITEMKESILLYNQRKNAGHYMTRAQHRPEGKLGCNRMSRRCKITMLYLRNLCNFLFKPTSPIPNLFEPHRTLHVWISTLQFDPLSATVPHAAHPPIGITKTERRVRPQCPAMTQNTTSLRNPNSKPKPHTPLCYLPKIANTPTLIIQPQHPHHGLRKPLPHHTHSHPTLPKLSPNSENTPYPTGTRLHIPEQANREKRTQRE